MEILEVKDNKEQYMDLLLLGDEQENMIAKYLQRGKLFALYEDYDLKTTAVVTKEGEDYEIKNIATHKIYQRKGFGSAMIKHIIKYHESLCKKLLVGTGEVEKILLFYENLGFTYSHTVKDFFTKNYDHPIMENGVQLKDMIYMKYTYR